MNVDISLDCALFSVSNGVPRSNTVTPPHKQDRNDRRHVAKPSALWTLRAVLEQKEPIVAHKMGRTTGFTQGRLLPYSIGAVRMRWSGDRAEYDELGIRNERDAGLADVIHRVLRNQFFIEPDERDLFGLMGSGDAGAVFVDPTSVKS